MNGFRLGQALLLAGAMLAGTASEVSAQKRQRDRITRAEIMASQFKDMDMWQVIRAERPQFLEPPKGQRSVGAGVYADIAVFIDERTQLELGALRTMSPRTVEEVRYLSPSASVSRFGPKVNGGAILLKTYKGSPKDTLPPQ